MIETRIYKKKSNAFRTYNRWNEFNNLNPCYIEYDNDLKLWIVGRLSKGLIK